MGKIKEVYMEDVKTLERQVDTSFEEFVFDRICDFYYKNIESNYRFNFIEKIENSLEKNGSFKCEDIDVAILQEAKKMGYVK